MKTHGRLHWHANYAAEEDYRRGSPGAKWGILAAPYVTIKVKRLFPRADPLRDGWVLLADTPEVARDLEWLLDRYPLDMTDEHLALLHARADEHRATEAAVHEILTGQRTLDTTEFRRVAASREHRDYQYLAADLTIETGRLLLLDQLGLGKTMSGLLVLRAPDALPAVVVCQTHLPTQWQREIRETFPFLRTHVVRTMAPYDPRRHRSMRGNDPDILIVPYSKLRGWGDSLAGKVNTVIFDEIQELRRDHSQKWVAAARISDGARYRIGLSATPIYNYAGEIHTIFEILAPGVLGTREEFTREWRGHNVETIGDDHVAVDDPAALGVYLRAEGLMLRRTRKDVGRELPEVVRVPHSIDTDTDLLEDMIEDVGDLAELIVSKAARTQELWRARGEFDWKLRRATGLAKAPYVAEFVKMILETDEQVVLFGWHRDVYTIWQRKLAPWKPTLYTGTESPAQKQRSRDAFIDGEARVLLMSLRSGTGLDGLQEACHVAVFGELDWSPGMHEQCIGRLHRDGQDEAVVAYFLVSDGGTDPLMAEVLNLKRQQSEPLLDPDAPLIAPAADTSHRIQRLAEDVLARRRKRQVG